MRSENSFEERTHLLLPPLVTGKSVAVSTESIVIHQSPINKSKSPSAGPRMISGQRQSPEAVVVPVVVLPVVPKLVVVVGQMQGVVEVEETDSGVKSWARLMFNSMSGSGVGCWLASPMLSIVFPESSVVSVQVGFVGSLLVSSEFDSFSSIAKGVACPSNCVDKGFFVSAKLLEFVLTFV